ncbi:centrosome-associated protein CEP250 [Teleopsis dalmanni]|uniref:centrosome-associated protein CEP250 n=1 Tax=Teleopsis dalmanni TaxID=139649 RepID=UPI0018CF1688|nr:centrosome-associated protein CEP250 [Teleopsis dalmanni]
METDKLGELNQKIAEIKKRILLAEGQKTANTAEWQKQNRLNNETISTIKKDIKELTVKCGRLRNPLQRSVIIRETNSFDQQKTIATPTIVVGNVNYPIGAKCADDAIFLTDLKLTEHRKQLDLLRHRFQNRRRHFNKLIIEYRALKANRDAQNQNLGEKPPETLEEDANRRLVCKLENEIHRTKVQWMEAEHIRKKYRSIQSSLNNDSERFERSLRELEIKLSEQQTEINQLQQVHSEAMEMRDSAKVILQRQEQNANLSQKARERQAVEFRKQVELRKMELERIGRKLFFEGKTLVHQDSISSSTGEQLTGKSEKEEDPNSQLESVTANMENLFKHLMEVTGATSPTEVLARFESQKVSATRLTYLRNAAEAEKAELEAQRESLTRELEASKFTEVKETEVSQEVVENIKNKIASLEEDQKKSKEDIEKTMSMLQYIKDHLCEIIYKLQEVDESNIVLTEKNVDIPLENVPKYLADEAEDTDFINILKLKLQFCKELGKQHEADTSESLQLEIEEDELLMQSEPPKSPLLQEGEKPQPIPMCYFNLLAGRAQRAAGTVSTSPEQVPAAAAGNDEEAEVPSRNYLKRQSALLVESKSRRKPYRSTPATKRK